MMIKLLVAAYLVAVAYGTNAVVPEVTNGSTYYSSEDLHASAGSEDGRNQKWKLDESTRENIGAIKRLLGDPNSKDDLEKTADALQNATDKLIKECRMGGPDHDALHVWLEVYLKHLKQLKDPSGNRQEALGRLREDIRLLDADFQ